MLSIEELQRLMTRMEDPRVERKQSVSEPNRVRQAICAFANDLSMSGKPGYVLIGVDDKTGSATGLVVTDELRKNLGNMRLDGGIQPIPSMTVESYALPDGKNIVVVEVHPSEAPPVRMNGVTWVRPSAQRGAATPEEEKRLAERRVAGTRPFVLRPCVGSTIKDLDIDSFRRNYLPRAVAPQVLAENQRTLEDQLTSLRFLDGATRLPTYGGILAFGVDPEAFVPGAWVQLIRFEGTDRTTAVINETPVRGPILQTLRELEELLRLNLHTARVSAEGLRSVEQPDYPIAALRELVFNAVAHRSYEVGAAPVRISWFNDRVEIQNPGGLYGQVTAQNFGRVPDYRNPTLAEAMKVLGFVERFGSGIARAQAALANNGNEKADFEFGETHFLVTVRSLR